MDDWMVVHCSNVVYMFMSVESSLWSGDATISWDSTNITMENMYIYIANDAWSIIISKFKRTFQQVSMVKHVWPINNTWSKQSSMPCMQWCWGRHSNLTGRDMHIHECTATSDDRRDRGRYRSDRSSIVKGIVNIRLDSVYSLIFGRLMMK